MLMNKQGILFGSLFGIVIATVLVFVVVPRFALAAPGDANAMCTKVITTCGCMQVPCKGGCCGGFNMHQCTCSEKVNGGTIVGKCLATLKCEGRTFQSDVESGGMDKGGLDALKGIVDQLMQAMKGGGGGGGAPPPTDPMAGEKGCATYYQTTVPSSDPCAIYNPNAVMDAAGGTSNAAGGLLEALGGSGTQSSVSGVLQGSKPAVTQTTQPSPAGTQNASEVKPAAQGLSGDVRVGSAGATIVANLRQGLSEVAGFFGGSTGGASQALSAAGKLCSTRPWSGSFIGNVIPSSFFDGLCEWRGYEVGTVVPKGTSKISSGGTSGGVQAQQQSGLSLQPQASNVPPEVDIWAEPASARLGTRTYIFWNTRGVASCTEQGPSFSQRSLSGGASTVPISGPTTFTIECLTTASSTVKDSVTVQIAI